MGWPSLGAERNRGAGDVLRGRTSPSLAASAGRRPNPSLAADAGRRAADLTPVSPVRSRHPSHWAHYPPSLCVCVCVSRKRRGVDPCLSSVAWQKQTARSQTGSPPAGSLLLVRRRRWLAILRWRAAPLRQTRPPRSARAWMMLLRRCSGQETCRHQLFS